MRNEAGRTDPIWPDTLDMPRFPPLEGAADAEVCVIGAGIAGMTTAYLLAREGVQVVVIDDGPVGGGETGRTTAHLANEIDDGIALIEKMYGEEGARMAVRSHGAAIDRIELIVREEGIDCDFARVPGYLFPAPGGSREELREEMEAAHRIGWREVTWAEAPLETLKGQACLRFPRQAQFNPLRFLAGLARAIERDGGRIFTHSHVGEINRGDPVELVTNTGGRIRAGRVVVATNSPVSDIVAIHTKQGAYRTYVVGLEVPGGSVPVGLYWDTADPYHYVRLEGPEHEGAGGAETGAGAGAGTGAGGSATNILIVGGEDHKTGQADDGHVRFERLETWARRFFPSAGEVTYRWSGQVMEPVDGVAFIGRSPGDENIYLITGDSGQGMTHGVLGGMLLTDLIRGRENPWADFYAPTRKALTRHSGAQWVRTNLSVARKFSERVRGGEVESVEEVPVDSGRVIRRDGKKIAVYRDGAGVLHECSAICTHMKCVVHWNSTEGSWDCPCHGSRFDPYGKVLNGPALHEMKPVEAPAEVGGE